MTNKIISLTISRKIVYARYWYDYSLSKYRKDYIYQLPKAPYRLTHLDGNDIDLLIWLK